MALHPSPDTLNIFYQEPDPDRWFRYDRFARRLVRRFLRGPTRPGGVMMVALELMRGLDRLGISYRFNDFKYIKKHPDELVCLIGKPQLLFERQWKNPILFGAGIYSHPIECPDLFAKYPNVKKVLVPGEWMWKMFQPYYGEKVCAWPVGIDTLKWDISYEEKTVDFLIYSKFLWNKVEKNASILRPILDELTSRGLNYSIVEYGSYDHKQLKSALAISKAAIFLCEHETQGLGYQQILSTDTPILAWDFGGLWPDPFYFPHKVEFGPVSSVPYWDIRCGEKFKNASDFPLALNGFIDKMNSASYSPRNFILENLSLEKCALRYYEIYQQVKSEL